MTMKKFLLLLALFASASVQAQPVGSHARWVKGPGPVDVKSYFQGNDQLYSTNSGGSFALLPKSTFLTPAQGNAAYSLLSHNHDGLYMPADPDEAMLVLDGATDRPVRLSELAPYVQDGGALSTGLFFPSYGLSIRDNAASQFLSIGVGEDLTANRQLTLLVDNANRTLEINGDAEISGVNTGDQDLSGYSLTSHTHLSADVTDASIGGNTTSDAGLLAKYSLQGQLHGSVVNSSTAAVWGSTSGSGYAGFFSGGSGGNVILSSPTVAGAFSSSLLPIEATNISSGDIAHFNALSGQGMEVNNDGSLTWTSGTGASGTRTGLGLGTAAVVNTGTGGSDVPTTTQADARYIAQSIVAAKGDIVGASANDTPAITSVGTDGQLLMANSANASGLGYAWKTFTQAWVRTSTTISNIPAAITWFTGGTGTTRQQPYSLAGYTRIKVDVFVTTAFGGAGSGVVLRYRTSYSATETDYSEIGVGATDCKAPISTANDWNTSGWVDITAAALTDVLIGVFTINGNGTSDPIISQIIVSLQ